MRFLIAKWEILANGKRTKTSERRNKFCTIYNENTRATEARSVIWKWLCGWPCWKASEGRLLNLMEVLSIIQKMERMSAKSRKPWTRIYVLKNDNKTKGNERLEIFYYWAAFTRCCLGADMRTHKFSIFEGFKLLPKKKRRVGRGVGGCGKENCRNNKKSSKNRFASIINKILMDWNCRQRK